MPEVLPDDVNQKAHRDATEDKGLQHLQRRLRAQMHEALLHDVDQMSQEDQVHLLKLLINRLTEAQQDDVLQAAMAFINAREKCLTGGLSVIVALH